MKRRDLLKRISNRANETGSTWVLAREGANHEIYRLDNRVMIPVPRHNEIGERLAQTILRQCEPVFGERWWR
jgi:hypothetical protein